ncbi:hypothetical protein ACBJ59_36750 [Nonomuraea sp. MTCD27]|uniref:hypothetical protein n=1 Tax=Nonomuraea sp. MTCD27 TaxID=1676747 RepID=UPI0035BF6660
MIPQTERFNGSAPPPQRSSRAERMREAAAAKAERDRIRDEARRARARRAEEWAAERDQLRAGRRRTRKTANDETRRERVAAWHARLLRWWRVLVLVGAIVGVNIVAVFGQVTAFQAAPFSWPAPGAYAAAAVIESIAIYVGWHAHIALIEGDSVFRLRLASYGIAAGVAALNYHHYAPTWAVEDRAVMFGMASLLSPWLWAIHSRHLHRQDLRRQGLIDPRAPKFSLLRWLLHRAETWQALKWAVRHGEQSPTVAIVAVQTEETTSEADRLLDQTRDQILTAQRSLIQTQSDVITVMRLVTPPEPPASAEVTNDRPALCPPDDPEEAPVPVTEPDTSPAVESDQASDRERPDDQDNREAEAWIRRRMRGGRTPTQKEICDKYPFSKGWARLRVQAARDEMTAKGYRFLPGNVVQPPTDADTSADPGDDREATDEVSTTPTGDQS